MRCAIRAPPPPAALALLAVCLHLALAAADVPAADGREKRSSGPNYGFRFAKGRSTTGAVGGAQEIKGHSPTFRGGCVSRPKNPTHTTMQCHSYSGCRLACLRDYVFPNGEKRLVATCDGGKWQVDGTNWETIPDCMPECHPPCQNSGICVKPNVCNCSESYIGPQCQYKRRPCLNDSPLPANSLKRCSSKTCTITCIEGHKFPDGSSITNLVCEDGTWRPSRKEWSAVPDCTPTCHPQCENGGICLSYNTCQCPQNFRGPQCQYDKEVCNPQKLNFNGQYKCTGDSNALTCHLFCRDGHFNIEPADNYKCKYASGTFLPSPIPTCIYDTMVEMIPRTPTSGSHFITVESGTKTQTNWSAIFNRIPIDVGDVFHTTTMPKSPVPGTCYAWGDHYKTFDGRVLSFRSNCSYTLVQDAIDSTFSINMEAQTNGSRPIKVFAQDKEYTLSLNEGLPVLRVGSRIFNIPTQLPGVTVKYSAHFVEFSVILAGFSLMWDTQNSVTVDVKEHLWNRTVGLCGRIDGFPENDFQMKDGMIATRAVPFANSWQVERLGETCSSVPEDSNPCDSPSARDGTASEAATFCDKLLSDPHFAVCRTFVDVQPYYDACRWDYCACQHGSSRNSTHNCACRSIAMFVKQCSLHDVAVSNWRDTTMCPMECQGGRVYMACNPENQPTCGSEEEIEEISTISRERQTRHCIEGCYCPPGTVLHAQQCITREMCPCQLRGRSFPPGHTMPKDCNTCTCDNGRWTCTQTRCSARCSAIGDPHYATFDGKRYDFMGKCSYYLVKGDNYSIEAENVACAGAVSKNLGFLKPRSEESPSCTKSVTIKMDSSKIKLKQGREVFVNGVQVTNLPVQVVGAHIHPVSSLFIIVRLSNKLTVWWDGISSVYIDAPPSFHGKTRGLCGTFTMNQKDDFITPEEDIEQSVIAFANKWKTDERCANEPETERPQPCNENPHKKETANRYCSRIRESLFERCHWVVDPEPYYHNCMYDMCSCEEKVSQCLCPIIAAYAKECVRKGVHIDWRGSVRECGIHCPTGQQYQLCGNTCTRSCGTIAHTPTCERQCVEGCNCPDGQTLSDETGECIPVSKCPCQYNGLEFQPGQKEVRFSPKGSQLCICSNANWICRPATSEEIRLYPDIGTRTYNCSTVNNEEYTACLPSTPLTCKTMHNIHLTSPSICKRGCTCKKGFVLDTDTKKCIRPKVCPCHHGGRSYSEGSSIQEDCNTCICKSGKWNCTERVCAGVCSAWGDSHYKTFDSHIFDFHGTCDYLLTKGVISNDESFDVSIQNVECGSIGVSCSKSVTLKVGMGSHQEIITFTRDKPLPVITGLDRIQVRIAGLFVFAEVTDLGIVVQWDQGTRVYVKVAPKWKGKTKGLCGNYNDNMLDDFQTPSGGLTEVSANLFGDSWRLQPYCPESVNITDTCVQHPNRKLWAVQKCGVLKSSIFQPCHSEVPIEPYLERCIFDSCACDMGGDCECLCTALSAYAHECNAHGVHIRWRSQNLCPMQCDEKCSQYSPCIDTCPKTTCENQFIVGSLTHLCKEDTCVEGCELKPCPPGEIYYNKTALECVPQATCKTVCMEVGGIIYYEGDIMEKDDCHTCSCSRHKKLCKGIPCSTIPPINIQPLTCEDGWTHWINNHHRDKSKNEVIEIEPIPSETFLNNMVIESKRCHLSEVEDIQCRIVSTLKSHKNTSLNVSCNLDEGLVCYGSQCPDFEIRLLCKCGISTTPIYPPELITTGKLCDVTKPNRPHESNCHMFYQCVETLNGFNFVQKNCGQYMMYNKDTQVCDHPLIVISKWPECARSTEVSTPSTPMAPTATDTVKPTETITPTEVSLEITPKICEPGEIWKSCGIPCHQVCLYHHLLLTRKGFCRSSEDCVQGCVHDELSGGCPAGYMWRDKDTCVAIANCMCYSHSGEPVKPGEVRHESDCKVCKCINNHYVCDTSWCETTSTVPWTEGSWTEPSTSIPGNDSFVFVTTPSTATPPSPCEDEYVPLVEGAHPLPNAAFSASSNGSNLVNQPHFARILKGPENENAWTPAKQNKNQYLQVNLGRIQPIYGVAVQGGPSGFVTSYSVLFSTAGDFYHYVNTESGSVRKFRGPIDNKQPMIQMFNQPLEAQYIRFNPATWHDTISMRIEIYGCGETISIPLTTESYMYTEPTSTETISLSTAVYTTPSVECSDEMGLDNGMMSDQQIMVSSVKNNNLTKFGPSQLLLNVHAEEVAGKGGAWMPDLNDRDQWIQFDFMEPRNLTGFITKGSDSSNDWVETFKILYSHDGKTWNSIVDNDGTEKIFPGNYDNTSPHQNNLPRVLRTRYLRLVPNKWHRNIAVRAEVIGCFEPYPSGTPPSTTQKAPTPTPECQVCAGVPPEKMLGDECLLCKPKLWWNGETCVNRTLCPCFVNHVRYDVGKIYETEDCNECVCKLNGIHDCKKKECRNTCEPGHLKVLTPVCGCTCKPCPIGNVLCPTSNICINESFWCNGVEDCPDDERNCLIPSTPTSVLPVTTQCPVTCPPDMKLVRVDLSETRHNKGKGLQGAMNSVNKKGTKGGKQPSDTKNNQRTVATACNVKCVPITEPPTQRPLHCPKPVCVLPYVPVRVPIESDGSCYKCVPPHSVCNVTHNTVDTFDGIEFKHELCNHVLAEDLDEMKWNISIMKNCSTSRHCSRYLRIIHGELTILLHPDMSVNLDGVLYTSHEAKYLSGKHKSFAVYHVGDSLLFQSYHYGFWIIWSTSQNAKIGMTVKLYGAVRGLCGTFNGKPDDDRTTPRGKIVRSNIEFARSWSIPGAPECEAMICPPHLQTQAQEICNSVKASSFSRCHSIVELDRFVARCMESTCSCLTSTNSVPTCRCSALLDFVTTCESADASVDLSGWRTQHGCSVQCPPSFIYHDCYRHKCEPSCSGIRDMELCDTMPGTCFSGCFCPDGLLRHNDRCISPDECLDCVCDGFGDPQYMTFDRSNFTFNGNCTYVASQDYNRTYQVLVTNHQCHDEPASTCTQAIEVRYQNHSVSAKYRGENVKDSKVITSIDGKSVTRFPYKESSWLHLDQVGNSELTIFILPIQLEVKYIFHNYAFTVRLPSSVFGNKTEGLCGNCNRIKSDDLKTSNGTLANNTDEFGMSWLRHQPHEKCQVTTLPFRCKQLPPDEDPCLQLRDSPVFRKCRNMLDPEPYILACQYDLCHSLNRTDAACKDMEAYVADCERTGVCLDWRSPDMCPFKCPEGRQYRPCQPGCSRTCDNVHDVSSNCSSVVPDGCFCPEGQVLKGDECVNISRCLPCDTQGHFDGDSWQQDKCTNCTCTGTKKECRQQVCPEVKTICKVGMLPVEETSHTGCCKKIACVPGPPPTISTCPPPRIPLCREDQNATSVVNDDGCNIIVCKCKPCKTKILVMEDEGIGTDELEEEEEKEGELQPGEKLEKDNSGCCPKWIRKCYSENCPPQKCRSPLVPKNVTSAIPKCCPDHECVPPPRSCLIEDNSTSSVIVKEIGAVWHSGPCQSCECREISGIPESICNKVVCPVADINLNVTESYVLRSNVAPGQCCPSIRRTACKINDTILEPGRSVTEYHSDHCLSYTCRVTKGGTIERVKETERCNINCKMGWEYVKPNSKPRKCCGECKPSGCIQNEVLYQQGKKWKSPDNCTEYFCLLINGTVRIDSVSINCPEIPQEMQEDYLINKQQELGKCCKVPVFLGCKYNGAVYEEGETWSSLEDPCKRFSCVRLPSGQLIKKESIEICSTNCSQGWKYEPATSGSRICCGRCQQIACEFEGRIYAPNATWNSLNGCVNHTCAVTTTGEYQVISTTEPCPSLRSCAPGKIYQDKCCKRCEPVTQASKKECEVTKVSTTTDRVHVKEVKGKHGQCVNKQIQNFTECQGICFSETKYSTDLDYYIKSCNCCQPEKYTPLSIPMQCADGHTYNKTISVPSVCKCLECSETPTATKRSRPVF